MGSRTRALLLFAILTAPLGGCARLAQYQRADAEQNGECVRMCERLLRGPALGLCDRGVCTCYAPAPGWRNEIGQPLARIFVEPPPVSVASLSTPSP